MSEKQVKSQRAKVKSQKCARGGCAGFAFLFFLAASLLRAGVSEAMAPMRDGVQLATNIILPAGAGPWPVVLSRTPYGKDRGGDPARAEAEYTAAGYARVVQDCRGRFKSQGRYRAFLDDLEDGYDTIEWIARQPWSNGKVGMVGGSALGITANLTAMSGAPHLVCAFISVAHAGSYRYAAFPGGVFLQNLNEEWLKRQGVEPEKAPRPIHRVYDDHYRRVDMRNYYAKVTAPFVNVAGWYDIFSQAGIDNFAGLQAQGAGAARGNQKLVLGAFGHGPLSGDLKYPADAADRGSGLRMRWFEHWLKGVDNGVTREPAVRYYVMGDTRDPKAPGNHWRTASSWPPESKITPYYLHPERKLSAQKPGAGGGRDTYTYDPQNPVPTAGGNNLMMARGPMDQRAASGRPDVLAYETPPLEQPVEIAGQVTARLYVSTDAEDTDFMVKLVDVYPNGYQALVLDQAFRLRYHQGFEKFSKVERNQVYSIDVDLWSTALVFNRGHKIAVHVASSNAPRFEPHSNTWLPVDSYAQAVKAANSVYHDSERPSALLLPVTRVYPVAPAITGAQ